MIKQSSGIGIGNLPSGVVGAVTGLILNGLFDDLKGLLYTRGVAPVLPISVIHHEAEQCLCECECLSNLSCGVNVTYPGGQVSLKFDVELTGLLTIVAALAGPSCGRFACRTRRSEALVRDSAPAARGKGVKGSLFHLEQ